MTLRTTALITLMLWSSLTYGQVLLNEIMNWNTSIEAGQGYRGYCDWIELKIEVEVNLEGWSLSDELGNPGKWQFSGKTQLKPNSYFVVYADGFDHRSHTNFQLNNEGEWIGLFRPDGSLSDSLTIPFVGRNYAIGRHDSSGKWGWYDQPTPAQPNETDWFKGVCKPPVFSLNPGVYTANQVLSLSHPEPDALIRYTYNGEPVYEESPIYASTIYLSSNEVVQARAYLSDYLPSPVVTHSFWVNEEKKGIPLIALTTDPVNLWDDKQGIYVTGTNGIKDNGPASDPPRNWNQDWERETVLEYVNGDQEYEFQQTVGIKIFGGWSRAFAQKSLSVFARKEYGNSRFAYPFYGEKPFPEHKSFILRNSGNDWSGAGGTMIRDAFQHCITTGFMDVDHQAYEPTLLYLNGDYWGIHNQREKLNEFYLLNNHQTNPGELDLLKNYREVFNGNDRRYNALFSFIQGHPMTFLANFELVRSQVDLRAFMDYYILQIYINNQDWPGNNIKYWRAHAPGSRWRWLLYDTDFGFGNWNFSATDNTLDFVLEPNGPGWPNPAWSTQLFRSMISNPGFKQEFSQRYLTHLNYTFAPERMNKLLDSLSSRIDPVIQAHLIRWGGGSYYFWQTQIEDMRNFGQIRPQYARGHLRSMFNLGREIQMRIWWPEEKGGQLREHEFRLHSGDGGTYLNKVPLALQAIPEKGYEFVGWKVFPFIHDTILPQGTGKLFTAPRFEQMLDSSRWIQPVFVPLEPKFSGFSLSDSSRKARLSLHNPTDEFQYIGGYRIEGSLDTIFPSGQQLAPGAILQMEVNLPPDSFMILLRHPAGNLLDSLSFQAGPWPGATDFQLKHPQLNNENPTNWQAYTTFANPGWQSWEGDIPLSINEVLTNNQNGSGDEKREKEDWIELYNPNLTPIDLGGMYLSDDIQLPFRWQIPLGHPFETTIAPKDYIRLWADGDSLDGPLHLPFGLSKAGESVYLFEQGGYLLDSVQIPALEADVSLGRIPDGTGSWTRIPLLSTTPDGPNKADNQAPYFISEPLTKIYPEETYRYEIFTKDPNNDQVWQEVLALPQWAFYVANSNGNGIIQGTPGGDDIGEHLVVLRVWDGYTQSSSFQTFSIMVGDPAENRLTSLPLGKGILFPNPSRGKFTYLVNQADETNLDIVLVDMRGRQVWQKRFDGVGEAWRQEFDLNSLGKGIYVFQVWKDQKLSDWHKLILH